MNDRAAGCRDVRDLIDLFVSDDLEPWEADAVRLHMGRCEACRAEADACRRQRERLASLSSSQAPSQVPPFFWQGIQREILIGGREAAETANPAPAARGRRFRLRPIVYLSLIHISEPTRLLSISYAVFCLKKKNIKPYQPHIFTT